MWHGFVKQHHETKGLHIVDVPPLQVSYNALCSWVFLMRVIKLSRFILKVECTLTHLTIVFVTGNDTQLLSCILDHRCRLVPHNNCAWAIGGSSRMPSRTHRSRCTTLGRNVQVCGSPNVDHSHTSERTGNTLTRKSWCKPPTCVLRECCTRGWIRPGTALPSTNKGLLLRGWIPQGMTTTSTRKGRGYVSTVEPLNKGEFNLSSHGRRSLFGPGRGVYRGATDNGFLDHVAWCLALMRIHCTQSTLSNCPCLAVTVLKYNMHCNNTNYILSK